MHCEGSYYAGSRALVASKLACIPGVTGTKTTFVLKPYKTDGHVLVDDEDGKNTRLVVTP